MTERVGIATAEHGQAQETYVDPFGVSTLGIVVETERGFKIEPFHSGVSLPIADGLLEEGAFNHVLYDVNEVERSVSESVFQTGGRLMVPGQTSGRDATELMVGQVVHMTRVVNFYDPKRMTRTGTVFVECDPVDSEEVADMFDWRVTVLPEAISERSWRGSYSAQLRDLRTRVELVGAERMSDFAKVQPDIAANVRVEPIQLRHDKGLGQVSRVNFPYNLFSQEFDVLLNAGGEGKVISQVDKAINWDEWQKNNCVPLQFGSEQVVIPLKELQLSPNEMGSYRIREMIQMAGEIEDSESYIVLVPVVHGDDRTQKYLTVFASRDELQPRQLEAVERFEAEVARKQEFERQVSALTEKVQFEKALSSEVLKFTVDGIPYAINITDDSGNVFRIVQVEGESKGKKLIDPLVKAACLRTWKKHRSEVLSQSGIKPRGLFDDLRISTPAKSIRGR